MSKFTVLLFVLAFASGCAGSPPPDEAAATARFAECVERHGIVADSVEVEINDDGTVGSIALGILSEGDIPYEPVVRLACTQEVEASFAADRP
jgi:hypothetical protein